MLSIAIIGGGIVGLTAAIALRQKGFAATVYERVKDAAASQIGAGISLAYNATRVLKKLGLLDEVRAAGWPVHRMEFCNAQGKVLTGWDVPADESQVGITRKSLHEILLRNLGHDAIVLGKTCTRFEQDDASATAFFEDGTSAKANLLIGADGLRSVVRSQIHGEQPPRYAGFSVLRSLVRADEKDPPLPRGLCRIFWGAGQSLGTYHVGPGIVYIFGWRKAPEGVHVTKGERKQEWISRYRDWSPEIPKLLERMDEGAIHQTDIYDRKPVDRWGQDRVSLVGDAAHPMTFNMGQGACQGLEDIAVLWRTVPSHGEVPAALRAYEDERKERVVMFTTQSARIADVSVLDHPIGWRARNLLFRIFGRGAARGQKALQIEV